MFSCKKNMDHAAKQIVIDTSIASGAEFNLELKNYGDADDSAKIIQQGTSYSISEITNTTGTFSPVYHYMATAKTGLTDQVILSITEGNHGNGMSHHSGDSTTITINFSVK